MRPEGCEHDLLRALASMPFLNRLEMVAVTGWSRGAVYEAIEKLESGGFCASVLHATELLPQARRFHLTAAGLRRLADEEGMAPDELLRARPVSVQWRRSLMERLDAVASVYSLASAVSDVAFPVRFRWYRALPLDAAMTLPDGRTVGVVRQGPTADRSGFAKRLWRLRDWPTPGTVLVLAADEVRLRHARRALSTTDAPALLALERDAVLAGAGDPVWSPPRVGASITLRYALERAAPGGGLPLEPEPGRADAPADLPDRGAASDMSDQMLPVMLRAAEKRALDLISDWPWIALKELAGLMDVTPPRASNIVIPLEGFGLAARPRDAGGRLALTDRGLALLARRDRTSVAVARSRWSIAPEDFEGPLEWRNVTGRRTRQLLRNMEHTSAVHGFLAALTAQARLLEWEVVQLDPPRRASRHFRHDGGDASRQPRRLRRPAQGRDGMALLPGVGAARRAALHHVRPARPLSALLLISQAHRRPRRKALRSGRLRRRDRPDPLPARGAGGDAGGGRDGPPVGLPQWGRGRPGAAGTRMALPRRPGSAPGPAAPMKDE